MKKRYYLSMFLSFCMLALAGLLLSTPQRAFAQTDSPITAEPTRSVSVSGTGQSQVQPDMATITLGVETQAEGASAALTDNNQQMQSLMQALVENGVAEEDIQTQAVRLQPQYAQQESSIPQPSAPPSATVPAQNPITGYRAVNLVEVQVRDLTMLGDLIDAAVQAGSNQIQGIDFTVSDPQAMLSQAREAAWRDAQQKAEELATLAGVTLGPVLTMSEFSQTPLPAIQDNLSMSASANSVPIQPGTQQIQINLQVVWSLETGE